MAVEKVAEKGGCKMSEAEKGGCSRDRWEGKSRGLRSFSGREGDWQRKGGFLERGDERSYGESERCFHDRLRRIF